MAIENATQMLKESNPSGLDKRLLLPSIRVKQEEQERTPTGSDSKKIFTVLNQISDMLQVHNDDIVEELQTANQLLSSINKKTGAGVVYGKSGILGNNMITRGIGQIGRFAMAPVRGAMAFGRGAMNTMSSIAAAPYNLAAGAVGTARNLIGAPFRGIGNFAKNMFTNKDQKKLVELAIEDLDIQKQMLNVQEDTLDEVKALHKTYKDELRRQRRGNLDNLEDRRDKRKGAGLLGAAAGAGGKDDSKKSGSMISDLLKKIGGILRAAAIGGASLFGGKKLIDAFKGGGDPDKTKTNDADKTKTNKGDVDKGGSKFKFKNIFKSGPLAILGALLTAKEIMDVQNSEMSKDEKTVETSKIVGGGVGGTVSGILSGALAGGALGAAGFNPFTIAAGVIGGGIIGGFTGYMGGEAIGENVGESIVDNRNKPITEKTFANRAQAQAAIDGTETPDMYEIVQAPRRPMQRGRSGFKVAVKNYDDSIQRMGRGMGVTTSGAILSDTPPDVQTTAPEAPVVPSTPSSPVNLPRPNDMSPKTQQPPTLQTPKQGTAPKIRTQPPGQAPTVSTAPESPVVPSTALSPVNLPRPNDMLPNIESTQLISPPEVKPQIPMAGGPVKSFLMTQNQQDQLIGANAAANQIWQQMRTGNIVSFDENGNPTYDLSKFKPIKYTNSQGAQVTITDPVRTFKLFNPNAEGDLRYQPLFNQGNIRESVAQAFPLVGVGSKQPNEDLSRPLTITGDDNVFVPLENQSSKKIGDQSSLSNELMSSQAENNQMASGGSVNMPIVAPTNSNTTNVSNSNTTVLAGHATSTVDNYSKVVPV